MAGKTKKKKKKKKKKKTTTGGWVGWGVGAKMSLVHLRIDMQQMQAWDSGNYRVPVKVVWCVSFVM